MENASKALLIAGAILITILIISLGIMVYRNASEEIEDSNLDKEKLEAYNSNFEQYIGKQTGTMTRSLLSAAIASNGSLKTEIGATAITVDVGGSNPQTGIKPDVAINYVEQNKTYTISLGYNDAGVVNKITIQ